MTGKWVWRIIGILMLLVMLMVLTQMKNTLVRLQQTQQKTAPR
ncbi:MAG TPA: hypothetical protein VEK79_23935 [Thermoanaerobaculia bacterium]|nr:hypothetical protein [Thermoanaerobaculia bacterium]